MNPDEAEQALFGQTADELLTDLSAMLRAVDLRVVPKEDWEEHVGTELELPEHLQAFLDGQGSFSRDEVQNLEEATERALGIEAPYGAYLFVSKDGRATMQLIRDESAGVTANRRE